ncbi:MAG: replicative DNA helicase [Clostridia bacterium]|nr:replicative DNA helicase [Clostridia bacterium]
MPNEVVRTLPCSVEAEQYVLGSVIFDNECIPDVVSRLKVEDFYLEQHKIIYNAVINLSNSAQPIDIITLKNELQSVFDNTGGVEYLTEITLMVSTTSNLKHHIKIIEDMALLRRLIRACGTITDSCYSGTDDVNIILNNAESKIYDILQNRQMTELYPLREILADNLSKLEDMLKNKNKSTGVMTGFTDLDYHINGFQPSDLVLIAARPAMGKTSFALNIATNAAVKYNIPVAIFSLEMSKEQLANRILCSEALIESEKMRRAEITGDDMRKLVMTINNLSKAPIYIDDTAGITVAEIKGKCKKLKLKNQLGLIVIDYLQLIQGNSREGRQNEVGENSRLLKILAKELDVPVITLSQLSRASEKREQHRPVLSDLRDSGSIEQDADMVMFLYRDEYYNEESEKKNVAECIIAKFRNGSTGTIEIGWRGEFTKFMNLSKKNESQR